MPVSMATSSNINMAKITFTRYLEHCEPYKENMAKLSFARNFQVSG
jgi:hypothetical protein